MDEEATTIGSDEELLEPFQSTLESGDILSMAKSAGLGTASLLLMLFSLPLLRICSRALVAKMGRLLLLVLESSSSEIAVAICCVVVVCGGG